MMGHRVRLIDGDEYDAIYWRHVLKVMGKPGVAAKTKRRIRRRERRIAKLAIRREAA